MGKADNGVVTVHGVAFGWLTFDEGCGCRPGFLGGLEADGLLYVGEVPRSFATTEGPAERVATTDPRFTGQA